MAAAIVRVTLTLDEPSLFELVEHAHELAAVEVERVGDHRLGSACPLSEGREHAVLIQAEPCLLELLDQPRLERVAEPLCDAVNSHIAGRRGISTADPSKVTEAEMKKFLTFLPPQLTLAFSAQAAA